MLRNNIEHSLEGLRGLAAFAVVFGHIFFRANHLDPGYSLVLPGHYIPPGHFSVLIFFCLSGFVIGHTNRSTFSGWQDAKNYLKRRFVRLYPIYLFSILIILPWAFEFTSQGLLRLVQHLTFTNVLFGNVYSQNNPLWSLNYEVFYYLLFIPLSLLKFPRGKAIIVVLALAIANALMHTQYNFPLLTSYLLGYVFWLTGLKLSEYNLNKRERGLNPAFVLSVFFLTFCIPDFMRATGFARLFDVINSPSSVPWIFRAIEFGDLLILPFCVFTILVLCNTEFKGRNLITLIAYSFPAVLFMYAFFAQQKITALIVPGIFYGIALLLLLAKRDLKIIRNLVGAVNWTGGISYAVYVIHFPLLLLFHSIGFFSGTVVTVSVRLVLFLAILVGVSYLLEKIMQPAIRNYFFRKPAV